VGRLCGPGHATAKCNLPIQWAIREDDCDDLCVSDTARAQIEADIRTQLHDLKSNGMLRSHVEVVTMLYVHYLVLVECCLFMVLLTFEVERWIEVIAQDKFQSIEALKLDKL
jgi:hypothetical protein